MTKFNFVARHYDPWEGLICSVHIAPKPPSGKCLNYMTNIGIRRSSCQCKMPPGTTASDPVISSLRCKFCVKTFSSFNTLRRHERLIHNDMRVLDFKSCIRVKPRDVNIPLDSPLRCTFCHKVFSCSSKRRRHERTIHAGDLKTAVTG